MPWEIPMMLGRVLQGQEAQVERTTQVYGEINSKLDRIDARLAAGDARMAAQDVKQSAQDERLSTLEAAPPPEPAATTAATLISAAERWGKYGLAIIGLPVLTAWSTGGWDAAKTALLGAVLAALK
jgi:hypothetical protein